MQEIKCRLLPGITANQASLHGEGLNSFLGPFSSLVLHGLHAYGFPIRIFPDLKFKTPLEQSSDSASCLGESSFFQKDNQGPERFRNLFKFTQLISRREGARCFVFCLLPKRFFHHIILQFI